MFWKFSAVPLMLAPACVAIWLFVVQLVVDPNQDYSVKYLLLPCMPLWNTRELYTRHVNKLILIIKIRQ